MTPNERNVLQRAIEDYGEACMRWGACVTPEGRSLAQKGVDRWWNAINERLNEMETQPPRPRVLDVEREREREREVL